MGCNCSKMQKTIKKIKAIWKATTPEKKNSISIINRKKID